ncbi:unnamed protein product, partial [Auanema sp. JU1783]
ISNSHLISSVDSLKEKAIASLKAYETEVACEQCLQACELAMREYVKKLENSSKIEIIPENIGNPWKYRTYTRLCRLLTKKLNTESARDLSCGWNQATELNSHGYSHYNRPIEEVEPYFPIVLRFLEIFKNEVQVNKEMAEYLQGNLFKLNHDQPGEEIKKIQ